MAVQDNKVDEFKDRVKQDWGTHETAQAWQKYHLKLKEQFGAVTDALTEAAVLEPGMRVLDLASGTGEPALSIASKVSPGGEVLATDFNPEMLAALEENARAEGITNVRTQVCEGHRLPFENRSFDRVTSRFGVMFFAETRIALGEVFRVLKPQGRAAFAVWGEPEAGTYFGELTEPFIRRLDTKPDRDGPGPMRYAEPGKLKRILEEVGFGDVAEKVLRLPAPYRGTPEELLEKIMTMAVPLRRAVDTLSPEVQAEARREVLDSLQKRYDGTWTYVDAPILIVTGQNGA